MRMSRFWFQRTTIDCSSLAATIASLVKVGFGRVVVAGMSENDESIVQETFRYLQETFDPNGISDSSEPQQSRRLDHHGSGLCQTIQRTKSSHDLSETNIPKGALQVLQEGFKGILDHNPTIGLVWNDYRKVSLAVHLPDRTRYYFTNEKIGYYHSSNRHWTKVLYWHHIDSNRYLMKQTLFGLVDQHKIVPEYRKFLSCIKSRF